MAKHLSATKMKIPVLEVPELLLVPVSGTPSGVAPAGKLVMSTTGKLFANPIVGDNWVSVLATIDELSDFGITATPAELNILDGATLDVGELNILDGATLDVGELNILDGVTATTDEINYLDDDDLTAADLTKLAAITASADKINILDTTHGIEISASDISGVDDNAIKINGTPGEGSAIVVLDCGGNGLQVVDCEENGLQILNTRGGHGIEIDDCHYSGLKVEDAGEYGVSLGNCETAGYGPLNLVPATGAPSSVYTNAEVGTLAVGSDEKLYIKTTAAWQLTVTLSDLNVTATTDEINYLDDDDLTAADLTKLAAITASDAEINTLTASGISNADLVKLAAITSTDAEINTLASSGISNADLVKLAAVTATDVELNLMDGVTATTDEINYLDDDDLTAADLTKLAAITASDAEINTLTASGVSNADLVKLAAVTVSAAVINDGATKADTGLDANNRIVTKVDTAIIIETDAATTARAQLDATGLNIWDGTNLVLSALETGAVALGYGANDTISLAAGVLTMKANELDISGASNSGITLNNATAVGLTITDAGTYGLSLGACETGSVGPMKFTPASGTPAATYGSAGIGAVCMGADEKLYIKVTAGWVVVGSQS